jgi:hypothetical protein
MDDEKLMEELRALRRDLRFLLYSTWALGVMENLRAQIGSQSKEPMGLNLSSPEGRKLGLDALNGFLALVKFAMDECEKPGSTFPITSPWKM